MTIVHKTLIIIAAQLIQGALGLAQQTAAAPQEPATVEGMVINSQNSRSVPRAQVMLQRIRGPQSSRSTRTDGNGHFIFRNVDPGTYRLSAERLGFFSDSHKMGFQPLFDVASGAQFKDLTVRLIPSAVVTGDVVDEYNDPIQNVSVEVFSAQVRMGQIALTSAGSGLTDDRGEYRIPGLRPGKYYVVANYKANRTDLSDITIIDGRSNQRFTIVRGAVDRAATSDLQNAAGAPPEPSFTYPALFYPNTSDFLQAQQLPLNPGDEAHANFLFYTMPSVTIRGRVVNGMTGQPAAGATVSAFWTEYLENAGVPAKVSGDGTFEIRGLSPGTYTLRALFTDNHEEFAGQSTVEVGNQGTQNVQLACLPGFNATIQITVEGISSTRVDRPAVTFIAEGPMPRVQATPTRPLTLNAQLRPLTRYHVNIPSLPEDYYLKSVLVAGQDVPKDDLVVSGRRGEIELVVSPSGGHIEGTLFDQKEQPTHGSVLLVPDSPNPGPPDLFRRASSDAKGKFSLRGITPGSYRLVAFDSPDLDEEIHQPDFLRTIGNQGQNVIVEEGGSYIVAIKMTP